MEKKLILELRVVNKQNINIKFKEIQLNAYLNVQLQIEHIIFRLTIQVQDYSVHLQILLHAKILIQHNNYISNMIQIYVL